MTTSNQNGQAENNGMPEEMMPTNGRSSVEVAAQMPASDFLEVLDQEIQAAGGEFVVGPEYEGAVGRTMFDLPQSKDNIVPVLLPREVVNQVPSQSLVCIKSLGDNREYRGIVIEGPFHDPDGLRADAPVIVTTTVRGATFMPNYHGRIMVEIIGEIVRDEEDDESVSVIPPRFRPLPNSPVWVLGPAETASALRLEGDLTLGLVIGHDDLEVRVPLDSNQFSSSKLFLPRHIGVLGTTGGGKSTTVSHMIDEMQQAQTAVVLFDTEGEYTTMNEPTERPDMLRALKRRGLEPHGVESTRIVHLVGRETSNEDHPDVTEFTLQFEDLTPYAVMGILDLNEAQVDRYTRAYGLAKRALYEVGIYPVTEDEKAEALEVDDVESGYPRMTLGMMYDIVRACAHVAADEPGQPYFGTPEFYKERDKVMKVIGPKQKSDSVASWRTVQGRLNRLARLKIFDNPDAEVLDFDALTQPGTVTIVDLSGTDSTQVNNLVIASLLRGLLEQQEENARRAEKGEEAMRRVAVIIEEAHEFLSAERVKQMQELFQQVARIARRGRKRWLGLVFVTQLPQHLPDEVLGLINSYVLHKIGDANVISRLKRSVGGVEDGLWNRLPNLAPGQAIIATPTLARALLVAMDPTPCRLRLVD